jgi:hypothetical protein
VPLSVSDIENAPVSVPVRSGKRRRIRIGSDTCATATPAPATSVPANNQPVPSAPRRISPAAVAASPIHSTRSSAIRRASRGARGASRPRHRTGPVVSSPDAVADRPRSARTVSSSGGRLANSVRRLRPSRSTAATRTGVLRRVEVAGKPAIMAAPACRRRGRGMLCV